MYILTLIRTSNEFNIEEGSTYGFNYLNSCIEEMKVGLRAMGKTSLKQLTANDLVSYDETTAKMAKIAYSFKK